MSLLIFRAVYLRDWPRIPTCRTQLAFIVETLDMDHSWHFSVKNVSSLIYLTTNSEFRWINIFSVTSLSCFVQHERYEFHAKIYLWMCVNEICRISWIVSYLLKYWVDLDFDNYERSTESTVKPSHTSAYLIHIFLLIDWIFLLWFLRIFGFICRKNWVNVIYF